MEQSLVDAVLLDAAAVGRANYAPVSANWIAELELWFAQAAGKSRLMRRRHLGPLVVQRPFFPEKDGTCHVYILHPPGGVAAGDHLNMRFHLAPASRALVTTPAATKFYRSSHGYAEQLTAIDIANDAVCEYLPQETIFFDGADARIDTSVTLSSTATFVGWDFFCLGRPAAGERFESGQIRQSIKIVRDGRPIWFERMQHVGGSLAASAPYALAGNPTWGTMVYAGPLADGAAEQVRTAIGADGEGVFSATQLQDVFVCRYLGPRVADGKELFCRAWGVLRNLSQGKAAVAPRIWAT